MMNTRIWSTAGRPAAELAEVLHSLGFTSAAGGYELVSEGLRLEPGRSWWTLRQRVGDEDSPGAELLMSPGHPGLWKRVRFGDGIERLFALPARLLRTENAEQEEREGENLIGQTIQWALETAKGRVPEGWAPPEPGLLDSWFGREQLTVVNGGFLRQGDVITEPTQFALRFPIVPMLPPGLTPARRAWLRVLLEEAQNRWHLIRCGWLETPDGISAVLEVDLTGVPRALHEDLFVTSLEAVRWTVQWLGEPADWLADVAVASELLAVCPNEEPTKGTP